jgi:hypothetical protein
MTSGHLKQKVQQSSEASTNTTSEPSITAQAPVVNVISSEQAPEVIDLGSDQSTSAPPAPPPPPAIMPLDADASSQPPTPPPPPMIQISVSDEQQEDCTPYAVTPRTPKGKRHSPRPPADRDNNLLQVPALQRKRSNSVSFLVDIQNLRANSEDRLLAIAKAQQDRYGLTLQQCLINAMLELQRKLYQFFTWTVCQALPSKSKWLFPIPLVDWKLQRQLSLLERICY